MNLFQKFLFLGLSALYLHPVSASVVASPTPLPQLDRSIQLDVRKTLYGEAGSVFSLPFYINNVTENYRLELLDKKISWAKISYGNRIVLSPAATLTGTFSLPFRVIAGSRYNDLSVTFEVVPRDTKIPTVKVVSIRVAPVDPAASRLADTKKYMNPKQFSLYPQFDAVYGACNNPLKNWSDTCHEPLSVDSVS
jgi:hypothetical protein